MKHLQKVYGHNLKSKQQDQKNEVVPRFCPEDEVEAKNNKVVVFKGVFLAKITNLKRNGQKNTVMKMINTWIKENID